MRPYAGMVLAVLFAATLVAGPVAAATPAPEGLREVATLPPSSLVQRDFTADGGHLVMDAQLDDTPELWSWDLTGAGAPTAQRISADYVSPVSTGRFEISGDAVVHERVDGADSSLFVSAVDGSAGPVPLRSPTAGRRVSRFGTIGPETWLVDDYVTDNRYELRLVNHQALLAGGLSAIIPLSPPQQGGGVGDVVPTSDGGRLVFVGRTDSATTEVWTVPTDGTYQDAVRLSPDGSDPVFRIGVTADGTRAVWSTIATAGSTYTFTAWSAPLTGTRADAVELLTFSTDSIYADFWLLTGDPTSRHVVAQMVDNALGPFDFARVPVTGGTVRPLDFLAGATDGFMLGDWTSDGLPLMDQRTSDGEHLITYPDGTSSPRDLGLFGRYRVDVRGGSILAADGANEQVVAIDPATASRKTLLDVAPRTLAAHATPQGAWIGVMRENPVYESLGLLSRDGSVQIGPFDLDPGPVAFGQFELDVSPDGSWLWLRYQRDTNGDANADEDAVVVLAVPPSAPQQLAVTAGDRSATVTWGPPVDGGAPTGYEVTAIATDGSGAPPVSKTLTRAPDASRSSAAASARVPAVATSATLDGLVNGVTYKVSVTAYGRGGAGPAATRAGVLPLEPGVGRIAGTDRIATAVAASQATFAPGVDVAYVATARNFPDALAAGPAAARDGAPILLTEREALPEATALELDRLDPGRIVVLGGDAAVSNEVVAALASHTDGTVRRLEGADRYATAAAVVATFGAADTVYVATGAAFPDALAGAALAARSGSPILLVRPNDVPQAAIDQLDRLQPKKIVILGGTGAVGLGAEGQLVVRADDVIRLAGDDRYETSAAIADEFPTSVDLVYASTGTNFPDALAGAAVAARTGSPVVLVRPDAVPDAAATAIERLTARRIVVLGGTTAVSAAVADQLAALLP